MLIQPQSPFDHRRFLAARALGWAQPISIFLASGILLYFSIFLPPCLLCLTCFVMMLAEVEYFTGTHLAPRPCDFLHSAHRARLLSTLFIFFMMNAKIGSQPCFLSSPGNAPGTCYLRYARGGRPNVRDTSVSMSIPLLSLVPKLFFLHLRNGVSTVAPTYQGIKTERAT